MSESEADPRILPWPGPPGPPGRPPSGAWPPCPPGPGPGPWPRPPDFFSALYWLNAAYDDVKATKAFLRRLIQDLISEDPTLIQGMGVAGVTDGSSAQPGQVGEVWDPGTQTVSFPANSVNVSTTTSMGVLPPGDWMFWAWAADPSVAVQAFGIINTPQPAGVSQIELGVSPGASGKFFLSTNLGYAHTSQPSLMLLQSWVDSTAAGTIGLGMMGRRVR